MILNITSKNNDSGELEIVEIVKTLYHKYDLPAFTQTIIVEKNAVLFSIFFGAIVVILYNSRRFSR